MTKISNATTGLVQHFPSGAWVQPGGTLWVDGSAGSISNDAGVYPYTSTATAVYVQARPASVWFFPLDWVVWFPVTLLVVWWAWRLLCRAISRVGRAGMDITE